MVKTDLEIRWLRRHGVKLEGYLQRFGGLTAAPELRANRWVATSGPEIHAVALDEAESQLTARKNSWRPICFGAFIDLNLS